MNYTELLYNLCTGCSRMKRIDSECEACTQKNQRLLFLRTHSTRIDQVAKEIYIRNVGLISNISPRSAIDMAIAYVDEFEKFRKQETLSQ
jgi:hypothetical protein